MSKRVQSTRRNRAAATEEDISDGAQLPAAALRALGAAIGGLRHAIDADQAAWQCVEAAVTALPATGAVAILEGHDGDLRVAAVRGIEDRPVGPLTPEATEAWLEQALGAGWVAAELPAPSRGLLAAAPSPGADSEVCVRWPLALLAAMLATTLESFPRDSRRGAEPSGQAGPGLPRIDALRLALRGFSHDVRSPLQAVMMQTSLLASGSLGELSAEQRSVLQDMREGLNSIRDTARAAWEAGRVLAGEVELTPSRLRVDDLVDDALAFARGGVEARGHRLEDRTGDGLRVTADGGAVIRILCALLDNAAKFCPRGGSIVVEAQLRAGDGSAVELKVHDSGPGVPDELADGVFEPYTRAARGDTAPGTGLGLTLARALARAMGGDLVLERREGRLACFTLSLPAG